MRDNVSPLYLVRTRPLLLGTLLLVVSVVTAVWLVALTMERNTVRHGLYLNVISLAMIGVLGVGLGLLLSSSLWEYTFSPMVEAQPLDPETDFGQPLRELGYAAGVLAGSAVLITVCYLVLHTAEGDPTWLRLAAIFLAIGSVWQLDTARRVQGIQRKLHLRYVRLPHQRDIAYVAAEDQRPE